MWNGLLANGTVKDIRREKKKDGGTHRYEL